jgi:hypothetical protein
MSMSEDVARYVKAGLAAEHHTWDREVFIRHMSALLEKLRADKDAVPAVRFGLSEAGMLVVWHYLLRRDGDVGTRSHEDCEPDECFDISHPCPPFC